MKLISGFIFHIVSNSIAILAAAQFVPGFKFTGGFIELLMTAVILTAINTFIKPLLKLFLGPFIVLTLGLLIVVVNAISLYLLDLWSTAITIQGIMPLIWATILIGTVNTIVNFAAKRLYKHD